MAHRRRFPAGPVRCPLIWRHELSSKRSGSHAPHAQGANPTPIRGGSTQLAGLGKQLTLQPKAVPEPCGPFFPARAAS